MELPQNNPSQELKAGDWLNQLLISNFSPKNKKMNSLRKPEWLKKKISHDSGRLTTEILTRHRLNTVCREAKCPNIGECFKNNRATFLILGKHCTRNCLFCHVEKKQPSPVDFSEPDRIAGALKELKLSHIVITSVTRDDLEDGGSDLFVRTVEKIRKTTSSVSIELLIPDFKGSRRAIKAVASSACDIVGHNLETVKSLYALRPLADYERSLNVLRMVKEFSPLKKTKSALMLGLGETRKEIETTLEDIRKTDCDYLALGQYLRPSLRHAPVRDFKTPQEFDELKKIALSLGFKHVESAPFVRSSYHADRYR